MSVPEGEQELQEYMQEPTEPVRCLPDVANFVYWKRKASSLECRHGGPGSTIDFWLTSSFITRLTLGVKMHPTAAFLSMPYANGIVIGGAIARGFNDGTERGYPLLLTLSTRQVSDIVKLDEEILRPKVGRLHSDGPVPAYEDSSEGLEASDMCAPIPKGPRACMVPTSCEAQAARPP